MKNSATSVYPPITCSPSLWESPAPYLKSLYIFYRAETRTGHKLQMQLNQYFFIGSTSLLYSCIFCIYLQSPCLICILNTSQFAVTFNNKRGKLTGWSEVYDHSDHFVNLLLLELCPLIYIAAFSLFFQDVKLLFFSILCEGGNWVMCR